VPKPFPAEFRRDVIAVARKGEASVAQVARDFGISESCRPRWL
jgi:transposase